MFSSNASQVSGGAGGAIDPQFNYVTMLLHGDGTNGAQNNTFVDSSTNNFTITRNGNTTQGSFSPYGALWSNYFDGSGDYLSNSSAGTNFGTGAFTVEFWFYRSGNGPNPTTVEVMLDFRTTDTTSGNFAVGTRSNGQVVIYGLPSGSGFIEVGAYQAGWNHVAIGSNATNFSIWVNGSRVSNPSVGSTNYTESGLYIGAANAAIGGYNFNGYISNLRVVKGSDVYGVGNTSISVSTSPLTAITNTQVLTCQSNRFRDASTNNFTITPNGNVSVQRFSPFAPTAEYISATIGGSGYFPSGSSQDSTSPYPLAVPNNSAFNLSGDFTVEVWHYGDSFTYSGSNNVVLFGADYGAGRNQQMGLNLDNNAMALYHPSSGLQTSSTLSGILGAWNHYAYVRSGSTATFYFNGVNVGSVTNSQTFTMENGAFGALGGYGGRPAGYLADFRVSNGTVLYTSNFTPPTAPLTAISGTTCLLNMTNGAIFDNAMMNNLETVGNAQISTSVKKYGTGSLAFDGSGDLIATVNNPSINLEGDLTVEAWVYQTVSGTNSAFVALGIDVFQQGTFSLYINTDQNFGIYVNGSVTLGSTVAAVATWHHIAMVRSGSTITGYLNGTSQFTTTNVVTFSGPINLGSILFAGVRYYGNGYIDDLRITKGVARYTANFTPPTQAFPNQ